MRTTALSITPTASWGVGTQDYQLDFVSVAAPGSASSGFTTAAAPKVGGVGTWVAPALLGTALLPACSKVTTIQEPDGSLVTIREYNDTLITIAGGGVLVLGSVYLALRYLEGVDAKFSSQPQ